MRKSDAKNGKDQMGNGMLISSPSLPDSSASSSPSHRLSTDRRHLLMEKVWWKFLVSLSYRKKKWKTGYAKKSRRSSMLGAAAYVRTRLNHLRRRLILILLEILHEKLAEFLNFALEICGAVP